MSAREQKGRVQAVAQVLPAKPSQIEMTSTAEYRSTRNVLTARAVLACGHQAFDLTGFTVGQKVWCTVGSCGADPATLTESR